MFIGDRIIRNRNIVIIHNLSYDYMLDYITPFSELEDTFRRMRHHIGVLKMNHMYFSSLFVEPELSSM